MSAIRNWILYFVVAIGVIMALTYLASKASAWDECKANDISCVFDRMNNRVWEHYANANGVGTVTAIVIYPDKKDSCASYADITVRLRQPNGLMKKFVLHAIPLLSRFYRQHTEVYVTGLKVGDVILFTDISRHRNRLDENQGWPACFQVK